MPELPEVETIVRNLNQRATNKEIIDIKIENEKVIEYPDIEKFIDLLTERTITEVRRRGKFIILVLDSGNLLIAHMRMTGRLYVTDAAEPLEKHTHLILALNSGETLRFVDPRRFGRLWLVPEREAEEIAGIDKLGLEPFDPLLTEDYLREKMGSRKKAVKSLLLDQDIIAGIGNIYADEICHRCKIHPAIKGCDLSETDFKNLALNIPAVLNEHLEECLSNADEKLLSLLDYRTSKTITTYQHQQKPCPVCGSEIKKIKVNGRGTCYCPVCQKPSST